MWVEDQARPLKECIQTISNMEIELTSIASFVKGFPNNNPNKSVQLNLPAKLYLNPSMGNLFP